MTKEQREEFYILTGIRIPSEEEFEVQLEEAANEHRRILEQRKRD